jgi:threonine dehydratase
VPAVIVMPSFAPAAKLAATRGYGAEIVHYDLLGESRETLAGRLAEDRGLALIPPFDHPDIVTGQGTAAAELVEDFGPLDLLLAPVGGGGLLAGSALAVHAAQPSCQVIGVEPDAGNDGCDSFRTGRLVHRVAGATIADGARTPSLGPLTFAILRRHAHELMSVPDAALIEAMRLVWERMKIVVEPTAVLGLAALMTGRVKAEGKRVGVILSGGNVDIVQAATWFSAG